MVPPEGLDQQGPFVDVEEIETSPAEVFLEDEDLAAIGGALRALEAQARTASATSRQAPSLAALLAIRIVLYTGCRHVEELLRGKLAWFRTDYGIPRLEVPRVKGVKVRRADSSISGRMLLDALWRSQGVRAWTISFRGEVAGRWRA